MLIRKRLPAVISDDLVQWLTDTGFPRMNRDMLKGLCNASANGEIELNIGNHLFTFHDATLTPPTGLLAANYSRYGTFNYWYFYLSMDIIGLFIMKQASPTSLQQL